MTTEAAETLRGFRIRRRRRNRLVRWCRKTSGVATTIALAVAAIMLFGLGFVPRTGAYRTLTVLSGSMEPLIPVGSMIVVVPVVPEEIGVGDVVTYNAPIQDGRVVTHRVVQIQQPGRRPVIVTKGDANAAPDPWRAQVSGDVVWRLRAVVPEAGKAITFMRSKGAHTATVFVLPGLLALIWIAEIWRRPAPVPAHV